MPHHHHDSQTSSRRLGVACVLTCTILAIEAVAGYAANSLALMSDAGHILTDACALGLAWYTMRLSSRPADARNTFGYRRSGILAALVNAAVLLLICFVVGVEALTRLQHPQHVAGGLVIVGASIAVLVNVYIATSLRADHDHNLNVRAAFLHVVGDIAASCGVIVSGVAVLWWHAYALDPMLSMAIALLIAWGAWQIVRATIGILMEATPRGVDLDRLREAMLEIPGVHDVHDLHVWSLADGFLLLTAHVAVPEQSIADVAHLLSDLKLLLRRRFHIEHATIEVECDDCTIPRPRPIRLHGGAGRTIMPRSSTPSIGSERGRS